MRERKTMDIRVSTEEPETVEAATAVAIASGIRDADAGRVVPSSEVRKLIEQWVPKYSTQHPR